MKKNKFQKGFTLIEMAVVILIMGLIVGSVFAFYSPQLDLKKRLGTTEKQTRIARALSDFVQSNGFLPCPAPHQPYADMGVARGTCTTDADADGTVPYRDLGLTQDDATDAYGNPFTYHVDPRARVPVNDVHEQCRTYGSIMNAWIQPVGTPTPVDTVMNQPKALFCCQRMTSGSLLEVYSDHGKTDQVATVQGTDTPPGTWATADVNFTPPATAGNLAYIAYVLVSHGKNGEGAYVFSTPDWNAPSTRRSFENAYDSDEENANDDNEFMVLQKSDDDDDARFFDDIVLWRTQQAVVRENGSNSCATP